MCKSCHMSGLPWLCVQGVEGWSADTFSSSAESAYFSELLPNGCRARFDRGDAKSRDSELS